MKKYRVVYDGSKGQSLIEDRFVPTYMALEKCGDGCSCRLKDSVKHRNDNYIPCFNTKAPNWMLRSMAISRRLYGK